MKRTNQAIDEDLAYKRQLIDKWVGRQRQLELQRADKGSDTPPHIVNELNDLDRQIRATEDEIATLEQERSIGQHSIPGAHLYSEAIGVRSTNPDKAKAKKLKEKLVEKNFRPDIIIGIARSGLIAAALLADEFGRAATIPVISLWPHEGFNNIHNNIKYKIEDFNTENKVVKIVIVDDICRSGDTLKDAKQYVEDSIDMSYFQVETAALTFYEHDYARKTAPKFHGGTSGKPVNDALGNLEPV